MSNPPLEKIKLAAPCQAEWKWMYGNDRVRFCGQCSQNVYNLSAMSREHAEDLIRRTEGRLCVRFYRRKDGTILTRNCSVGLQALKDKLTSTRTTIITAVLTFLAYLGILWWFNRAVIKQPPLMGQIAMPESTPVATLVEKSEAFIREKAVFKVSPIFHSVISKQAKGEAVVRVLISAAGQVVSAILIEGDSGLKEMVEEAARRWKFEPMLIDGRPSRVESRLTFQVTR